MGFEYENTNKNNIVYLEVKYQKLIQKLSEFEDGANNIEVINPNTGEKKTVYFRAFQGVTGMISGLKWYEYEPKGGKTGPKLMGYKLSLLVDDVNSPTGFTTAVVDLPFKGISFNTFTKVAENIDPDKPLTLTVWHSKDNDKTVVQFKQDGQTVKYKYTKDNMGDCPVAEYNSVTGYDFTKQVLFLKERIDSVVVPRFNQSRTSTNVNEYVDNYSQVQYITPNGDQDGYSSNVIEDVDTSFDITELENIKY